MRCTAERIHPGAFRIAAVGLALAVAVFLSGCHSILRAVWGLPPATHGFDRAETQMVAMSDGVHLRTQVFFPESAAGESAWPAILIRNPYNYQNGFKYVAEFFTRYGYVVIHQDCRGREGSEGEWTPFIHERSDGLDTLAWLVKQPWQDGNIAMFGMSYLAMVQWLVADSLPPEVKTLIPMVSSMSGESLQYKNGMFRHELATVWAALMPGGPLAVFNGSNYQKAIRHWPFIEADEKYLGGKLPWFREWLDDPGSTGSLWKGEDARRLRQMPGKVKVPVLMMGGWYDLFTQGQIEDFKKLASREESLLFLGPWTHVQGFAGDGDMPFPRSGGIGIQLRLILDWLDVHLRGAKKELPRGKIETYVIGEGRWITREDWPPLTKAVRYYLSGDATAGEHCKLGALEQKPRQAGRVSWDYDPLNPVPTRGGSKLLAFAIPGFGGAPPSSVTQPGTCYRPDVVSFVSEPLTFPMHLAGNIRLWLPVSTSAPDSSFAAKLIAIMPNGLTVNLQDDISAIRWRGGTSKPLSYIPGDQVTLELTLPPLEWKLYPHTRLRLDVSSSNFPAYNAHPNTAALWAREDHPQIARETLYTGANAILELPVWEEGHPSL